MRNGILKEERHTASGCWLREPLWIEMLEMAARAMELNPRELEKLSGSLAAELLAAIPFLSGCRDPQKIALANLTTFLAAVRCPELFESQTGESLASRLVPLTFFPGGDEECVEAGCLLLELISLKDHKHDLASDILAGKQNPLIAEKEYTAEKERILSQWRNLPARVQKLFGFYYDRALKAFFWY